jgi:toxin secretion/phage lysis holin
MNAALDGKLVVAIAFATAMVAHPLLANPIVIYATLAMIDVVAGLIYFGARRRLRSRSYTDGMLRKSMILLFLAALVWLEKFVVRIEGVATAACIFYSIGELLSITEKMALLGAPVPKWLRERLSEYQESRGEQTHDRTD